MSGLLRDLRHALRQVRREPWFATAVIALFALGIGLNAAIFTLVDGVLLRPLPVKHPGELVRLVRNIRNVGLRSYFTYDAYLAVKDKSASLADVVGFSDWNATVREGSGASRVRVQVVTGNFFSMLGVPALYGRVLTAEDEFAQAGAPPVVLSYSYWRGQFQSDRQVVGRIITLEERAFTVVGVTPQSFNGLEVESGPDIRVPLAAAALLSRGTDHESYLTDQYTLAARLRPGVGLAPAEAETRSLVDATLDEKTRALDQRLELEPAGRGISLLRPRFRTGLLLLLSGVGMLLLLICANVGGLLLARASSRRQEIAIRLAIGATGPRLVLQWMTESLVLTSLGAGAGIGLAYAAIPILVRNLPEVRDFGATRLTLSLDLRADYRLFAFTLLLCVVCTLIACAPAALSARSQVAGWLRSTRGSTRQPLRWTLVALQTGLCAFLLAGAGVLVSTFQNLRALDPGFDRDHVATFSVDPAMARYTPQQVAALETQLVARVRALPGVRSAGIAAIGLMHGTGMKTTIAPAGETAPRDDFMNTSLNFVTAEYFETMGIPLLAGRNFRPDETAASKPAPVLVNRAFVRRFSASADPMGRTFGNGGQGAAPAALQVAGVVGDAKYRSLREAIPPVVYQLWDPKSMGLNAFTLHVRTSNRPDRIIQAVRRELAANDPRLPFFEVRTLAQEVDATLWSERALAWFSSAFSLCALVLASLGLYATLVYAIAQSRREIGIRRALGARAWDILRFLSARPLQFAVLGVAAGLAAFYVTDPVLGKALYGVSPADPLRLLATTAGVLLVALLAIVVAVQAAWRLDPAILLREE